MALDFNLPGAVGMGITGAKLGAKSGNPYVIAGAGVAGALLGGFGGNIGKGQEKSLEDRALELQRFQQQVGIRQSAEAQRLQEELDAMGRPQMQAEVNRLQEVADISQRMAREGMPEAQRQAAAADIQSAQAMQMGGASGLGAGLRGVQGAGATTAQAYRELAAADTQIARINQQQYLGALGALAGAESRAEAYNTLMPYEQKVAEMQALQGAGIQNVMGGLQTGYDAKLAEAQMALERKASNTGLLGSIAPSAAPYLEGLMGEGGGGGLKGLFSGGGDPDAVADIG